MSKVKEKRVNSVTNLEFILNLRTQNFSGTAMEHNLMLKITSKFLKYTAQFSLLYETQALYNKYPTDL